MTRAQKIIRRLLLSTLLAAAFAVQTSGAQGVSMDSGLPLFADDETLSITIAGPLTTLTRERSVEDYYEGTLSYSDESGATQSLDLQFRARGNFRRRPSTCRFPPVRLNFKRKQVEGTLFEGQNILKLVTHCRPGNSRYEQYVLKEELAYRILNLHTPLSFRTRLLRVTWVNTEDDNATEERYGFLIEHKNELQMRTGMTEYTEERSSYDNIDPRQSAITAIFQYYVGNTDFSMVAAPPGESCCHNGILLVGEADRHHYVPYDFDLAGIVNAPYAEPNPRFNLRGVTDRLYRGHCRFDPEMEDVAALYLENQDAVMRMIDESEGFEDNSRRALRSFLNVFYDEISSPRSMQRNILASCLGKAP